MSGNPASKRKWLPPKEFYTPERCRRCGVCCGATDGHPCKHLHSDEDGRYSCGIYENRIGLRRTVNGRRFVCVEIRQVIETNGGYAGCAYVEEIRRARESMGQDASNLGQLEHP